jgi:hypothetical protein
MANSHDHDCYKHIPSTNTLSELLPLNNEYSLSTSSSSASASPNSSSSNSSSETNSIIDKIEQSNLTLNNANDNNELNEINRTENGRIFSLKKFKTKRDKYKVNSNDNKFKEQNSNLIKESHSIQLIDINRKFKSSNISTIHSTTSFSDIFPIKSNYLTVFLLVIINLLNFIDRFTIAGNY